MKNKYLIVLLFASACKQLDTRPNQKRAEDLAKHYLDSALDGQGDYKIARFGKIDSVLNENKRVRNLSIYVIYQGNDALGIYERHRVLIHIDTNFSRVLSLIADKPPGK